MTDCPNPNCVDGEIVQQLPVKNRPGATYWSHQPCPDCGGGRGIINPPELIDWRTANQEQLKGFPDGLLSEDGEPLVTRRMVEVSSLIPIEADGYYTRDGRWHIGQVYVLPDTTEQP